MKTTGCLAVIVAVIAGASLAQEPPGLTEPETLLALRDLWTGKKLQSERQLKEGYFEALEKLKIQFTKQGRLKDAELVQGEIERITGVSNTAAKPAEGEPLDLAELRGKFETATAVRTAKFDEEYLRALDNEKRSFQSKGNLDAALAFAEEIKRVRGQEPATSGETAPGGLGTGGVAVDWGKLLPVAEVIRGKGAVEGAADGVIAFDGPAGDGRRGAKGILLTPNGEVEGSTWSFAYARSGSARGLQIFHPRGTGQAIIHLNKETVGISTPKEWRTVGYGAGDPKAVKEGDAFDSTFPLLDDKEYLVVSRMAGNGKYELYIDDKLVVRANVGRGSALDFALGEGERFPGGSGHGELAFKGEGFPLQWEPHMAGLLLGPLDSGKHVCREVRYGVGE